MSHTFFPYAALLTLLAPAAHAADLDTQPGLLSRTFIYDSAPFPQCHASTIVALPGGKLVAAWFGGTREKHPDVCIYIAHHDGSSWSSPVMVADGIQHADKRYPCWNPVLHQPKSGPLMLFYKVGPTPETWWGMLTTSTDGGKTWSTPRRLPEDILGPVRNKPIELPDGTLLCPSSSETPTDPSVWHVHMELSRDGGKTWKHTGPLDDELQMHAIQPAILTHRDGRLQLLARSRKGAVAQSWSADGGQSWSPLSPASLPNPNSGLDAVTLADGRHLLVYNHVPTVLGRWGGPRSPLNVAVSEDGKTWKAALVLENEPGGEFSYPAVIQAPDGQVHITYTWKRRKVRHVVVDPAKLVLREPPVENRPNP